jgi:uncharacterized membrane protein (UPF0127 family)
MIKNATKGTILHQNPVWPRTLLQIGTGLMFRKPKDECLVFIRMPARTDTITMWFVFGSIDVVVLDGTGKVIALRSLAPWSHWRAPKASAFIELPVGTIARTKTALGDHIALPAPQNGSIWKWYHYALFLGTQVLLSILPALLLLLLL